MTEATGKTMTTLTPICSRNRLRTPNLDLSIRGVHHGR